MPVEPEAPLHDFIDILSRITAERAAEPYPEGHHKRKDACAYHGQRTEMPVFAAVGKAAEKRRVPPTRRRLRGNGARLRFRCGKGKIYSGKFDGTLINGNGITAELLMKNGIEVLMPDEYFN